MSFLDECQNGDHACLWGDEHACIQSMLYKHVTKYRWTIPVQRQSAAYTLVTLVLIANTFSAFIPLSFLSYFLSLILFLHFKLVFGYSPDSTNHTLSEPDTIHPKQTSTEEADQTWAWGGLLRIKLNLVYCVNTPLRVYKHSTVKGHHYFCSINYVA